MKNLLPRIKLTNLLAATCLALAPVALAVDPPPDGGYANFNTAEGEDALFSLTTGLDNTALGYHALFFNTTGLGNTATGDQTLFSNSTGGSNTANGIFALHNNTTGNNNTANGAGALLFNTTGNYNTANGSGALYNNSTGNSNTANGFFALYSNTIGSNNTATGLNALLNNTTGGNNIALGYNAGQILTTGSNNIDIGNGGVAGESGIIRIGAVGTQTATFISGIRNTPLAAGVAVGITVDGQLGVRASSARFKEAIKPMAKASEAILALRPVTFRYNKELDPEGVRQFGLVAEQVAKVDPDLVVRDADGRPYTVRYEEVNAMLLNEFLKEHRRVAEQSDEIAELKSSVAKLNSALQEQAAVVRKVTALVAADQPAPRIVSTTE